MKDLEVICQSRGKRFLIAVETSDKSEDYLKFEELRYEIWEDPNDNLAAARNMVRENFFDEGSCLFIGAYVEDEKGNFQKDKSHLVAFAYGFVGVKDKDVAYRNPENLMFYSQYTGVRPDYQSHNLGKMVKAHQRDMVLSLMGIKTISCTYDPLTGINAYRNVHVFGMDIIAYNEACYEDFAGCLNRLDVPCDRFYVCWDLEREIERPDYDLEHLLSAGCNLIVSATVSVQGKSGPIELRAAKDLKLSLEPEFLLVEIPFDFYRMLQETDVPDPEVRKIPVDWRMATRRAFQELFQVGYRIVDFRYAKSDKKSQNFYVLQG